MVITNNAADQNETGFQTLLSPSGVFHGRSLVAGSGISITNNDGQAGNPVINSLGSPLGPWTLIQSQIPNNNVLTFTTGFNSAQSSLLITFNGPSGGVGGLVVSLSTNSGSTYNVNMDYTGFVGFTQATNTNQLPFNTGGSTFGYVFIDNSNLTMIHPIQFYVFSEGFQAYGGGAFTKSTSQINAIKVDCTATTGGTVNLYGR